MPRTYDVIDRLESRLLFEAGPTVTNETFLGTSDEVSAVVITFNASLDPTSAQNPDNYVFGGSRGNGRTVHKPDFATPAYDDATHTVTLSFDKDFAITRFKRLKVVLRSSAAGEIMD